MVQATYTLAAGDVTAGSVINTAYVSGNTGSNTIRSDNASVTATLTSPPAVKLTAVSLGGVTSFTYNGTNGFGSAQTITTATSGVGVAGATKVLAATSTATTLTETIPSVYVLSSVSCTGLGSGTATPNLSAGTVLLDATAMAKGSFVRCTFTNSKIPTFKQQITTSGSFGGPFSFSQTNLASTPAPITTIATGTATPAAPTAINVSTIGTALTLAEAVASGFIISSAACTDSNSAITGNTGSFGSLAGTTLTVPVAKVTPGADFNCIISNAQAQPTLTIAKTYSTAATPVVLNQAITYSYVITNTGNVPMQNVQMKDLHGTPAVPVSLGSGGITDETLTTPGPNGAAASPDTTANDGIWTTLAPGSTVTFTFSHPVTQAEMDHG